MIKNTLSLLIGLLLISSSNGQNKDSSLFSIATEIDKGWYEFHKEKNISSNDLFSSYKKKFGLDNDDQLVLIKSETDELGFTHEKYQHYHKGYLVEGSEYLLHSKDNIAVRGNGSLKSNIKITNSIKIKEQDALLVALNSIKAKMYSWEVAENKDLPEAELVIIETENKKGYLLCYKFKISARVPILFENVYVDANSGNLIKRISLFVNCSVGSGEGTTFYNGFQYFTTRQRGFPNFDYVLDDECRDIETKYFNPDWPIEDWQQVRDDNNDWYDANDRESITAHWVVSRAFDYYYNVWGRNGMGGGWYNEVLVGHTSFGQDNASYAHDWDNRGTEVILVGHCSNCTSMAALDVLSHEYTHGIERYNSNLIRESESGAIKESLADIFAAIIQNYTEGYNYSRVYNLGEDIGIARSMIDPNLYNQPKYYQQPGYWYSISGCTPNLANDNCGVHTNNGVMNHWFYLLSNGGSLTRDGETFVVSGIALANSAAIVYRAMTKYLTTNSVYSDVKNATIYAAADLFGTCSPQVQSVVDAWRAVKVSSGNVGSINYVVNCADVTSKHNANQYYYATGINSLSITCALQDNKNTVIQSGNEVIMSPGFSSGAATYFEASINACLQNNLKVGLGDYDKKNEYPTDDDSYIREKGEVKAYPNPTSGKFLLSIENNNTDTQVSIYNLLGEKIHHENTKENRLEIDLKDQQNGIYIVEVRIGDVVKVSRISLYK